MFRTHQAHMLFTYRENLFKKFKLSLLLHLQNPEDFCFVVFACTACLGFSLMTPWFWHWRWVDTAISTAIGAVSQLFALLIWRRGQGLVWWSQVINQIVSIGVILFNATLIGRVT